MNVLISADELATALGSDHPPVLLDVRWQLGGPPGHESYLEGHVPGAVYVDLDTELAGHGEPTDGRHPLPALEDLQAAARRWGICEGDTVVAYDAVGDTAAARAWWLLRWAGIADVRLLDGALGAWTEAGHPLVTDDVVPTPGTVTLTPGHLPVLPFEQVGAYEGVLLDARAGERYRGEVEPIDPKAGHIPGATSAPTGDNLAADGRFLPVEELRARFAALGVEAGSPAAAYCGSGVTAAHQVAALAVAGHDAALFPGSWSQWSNHDLPVATGRQADG
ncbi:MAG: sulfurtransferase [Nocardioides sp.]|uniref:sulfurtransferase n=1 Tax=Nocardioides sp. TaxID=35761 RepID=UPI003D6B402D